MKKIAVFLMLMSACAIDGWAGDNVSIEKIFMEGRYEDVVNVASESLRKGSSSADDLYYYKGLSEMKLGRFNESRRSFSAMISNCPRSPKSFEAHVAVGDSYLLEGRPCPAIEAYDETLKLFPSHKNVGVVYYRLSEAYAKKGDGAKSSYYFDSAKLVSPLAFESGKAPVVQEAAPVPVAQEVKPGQAKDPEIKLEAKGLEKHVSIQVGSFKSKDNADRFVGKLYGQGFESHAEVGQTPTGTVYRVRVGKFTTREEARDTILQLKNRGYNIKICDDDLCE